MLDWLLVHLRPAYIARLDMDGMLCPQTFLSVLREVRLRSCCLPTAVPFCALPAFSPTVVDAAQRNAAHSLGAPQRHLQHRRLLSNWITA